MSRQTNEELVQILEEGKALPEHWLERFRVEQAATREIRKHGRTSILASRFTTVSGTLGLGPHWSNRRPRHRPVPPFLPSPPGLTCYPGFFQLAGQKYGGYTWGSHDQPAQGPIVNPQPAGSLPGAPCHKWSALTRPSIGEISLAALTANAMIPGYGPEEQLFLGTEGTQVAGSLSQLFYLPSLPGEGIATLQATARVSADHVREAISLASGSSKSNLGAAAVYGFATLTLTQGLDALFGGAPSRTEITQEFLTLEQSLGATVRDFSVLDDVGYIDLSALLHYDSASVIFVVEVEVAVCCAMVHGSDARTGAFVDLRFGDDDRLVVFPDGITSGAVARSNNPASFSCGVGVQDIKLCAV